MDTSRVDGVKDAEIALQDPKLALVVLVALEQPQTSVRLLDFISQAPLIFHALLDDLVVRPRAPLAPEVVQAFILVVDLLLRLG